MKSRFDKILAIANKNVGSKIKFSNWNTLSKFRTVAVDFDDCVAMTHNDGVYSRPNLDMIKRIMEHKQAGAKIYIVTARIEDREFTKNLNPSRYSVNINEFLVDQGIAVDGIIYTSLQLKGKFLSAIGAEVHYDNSMSQISDALAHGINGVLFGRITN